MRQKSHIDELGDRFGSAINSGDVAALDAMFAPDFSIWYNVSGSALNRDEALAFFGDYFSRVTSEFRDIVRSPTDLGWVQEHRVYAEGPDGFRVDGLAACVIFTLEDGLILHIREYIDSAQTPEFDQSQITRA